MNNSFLFIFQLRFLYINLKTTMAYAHPKAVSQDYNIAPRIDYRAAPDVEGPLAALDNVKFPKYAEIVNARSGEGVLWKRQVLEI